MKATGYSTWGNARKGFGDLKRPGPIPKHRPLRAFGCRFEGTSGAKPEELLAAAHASCFNQALADNLRLAGLEAESICTAVMVDLSIDRYGVPYVGRSLITTEATVPGATTAQFEQCKERAKSNCAMSRILNCDIDISATLIE